MNAAYLWAQLEKAQDIYDDRMASWNRYYDGLKELQNRGKLELPHVPSDCVHNAHMFYIKLKDLEERTRFIAEMKKVGINTVFHYIPLHSSKAGLKFGRFHGEDKYTTAESERLVRLPMYYGLKKEDVDYIVKQIELFF
jgi:dTDP-4-amino-4,6-dideoxygalactose transaminase